MKRLQVNTKFCLKISEDSSLHKLQLFWEQLPLYYHGGYLNFCTSFSKITSFMSSTTYTEMTGKKLTIAQ
jgi:hypothetical protein